MAHEEAGKWANCTETVQHSLVTVAENGRSATIRNPTRGKIRRIRVDGCVIVTGPRCDWLVSVPGCADVFIELKGKDVEHAVEQLMATLIQWRNHPLRLGQPKGTALVVCSQYPRFDTKIQRAKDRIARDFGVPLHIRTRNAEYDCAELCKFTN